MATKVEFKQQCPSCEAMVPIKDRKLIGRKIDCPKCKYRFVVEDPEEAAEEAPGKKSKSGTKVKGKGRPGADGDAKRKKKPGGSKTALYVGLGIGGAALVLLAIVGFLLLGSGDNTSKQAGTPSTGGAKSTPVPTPPPPPPEPKVEAKPPEVIDVTNLLPSDTESVMSVNVPRLLDSELRRVLLDVSGGAPGGFSPEAFNNKFGFSVDDIKRLVLASNETEGWEFSVVSTTRPIKLDELKPRLALKPAAKSPINGLEYYTITADLDGLGTLLFKATPKELALHQVNDLTLVIAHTGPMEKFLQGGGKPKQPAAAKPEVVAGKPPPQAAPPVKSDEPPPMPNTDIQDDPMPKPVPLPKGAQPGGAQPQATTSYLTLSPVLKGVLDRLDNKQEPVILSMAGLFTKKGLGAALQAATPLLGSAPPAVQQLTKDLVGFGASIESMRPERLNCLITVEFRNEDLARAFEKAARTDMAPVLTKVLQDALDLPVTVLDEQGNVPPTPPPSGTTPPGTTPPEGTAGPAASKIAITQREKTLTVRLELAPPQESLNRLVQQLQPEVLRAKGKFDMSVSRPRIQDLAAALSQYVAKNQGRFPRGTVERKPALERAGLPWRPDERLSWMVELLPHLGQGEEYRRLYESIQEVQSQSDKSWRDLEHAPHASALVPYFLSTGSPESSWWITYPGMFRPVGSTHFVGIAGVGLDAADPEFAKIDPNWQKKIGVFGYDRVTSLEDIKDGPSSTIAILQVPFLYKTPWLAGGGSTVRGVPEFDSVRPFVCTEYNGRMGTFAIMADGAVRFIPSDIPDNEFKALCTINGGESIGSVDAIAPLVTSPGALSELTTTPPPIKPAPVLDKPATPPDKSMPPDKSTEATIKP